MSRRDKPWTPLQDALLTQAAVAHNKQWVVIGESLGRTPAECAHRYADLVVRGLPRVSPRKKSPRLNRLDQNFNPPKKPKSSTKRVLRPVQTMSSPIRKKALKKKSVALTDVESDRQLTSPCQRPTSPFDVDPIQVQPYVDFESLFALPQPSLPFMFSDQQQQDLIFPRQDVFTDATDLFSQDLIFPPEKADSLFPQSSIIGAEISQDPLARMVQGPLLDAQGNQNVQRKEQEELQDFFADKGEADPIHLIDWSLDAPTENVPKLLSTTSPTVFLEGMEPSAGAEPVTHPVDFDELFSFNDVLPIQEHIASVADPILVSSPRYSDKVFDDMMGAFDESDDDDNFEPFDLFEMDRGMSSPISDMVSEMGESDVDANPPQDIPRIQF